MNTEHISGAPENMMSSLNLSDWVLFYDSETSMPALLLGEDSNGCRLTIQGLVGTDLRHGLVIANSIDQSLIVKLNGEGKHLVIGNDTPKSVFESDFFNRGYSSEAE